MKRVGVSAFISRYSATSSHAVKNHFVVASTVRFSRSFANDGSKLKDEELRQQLSHSLKWSKRENLLALFAVCDPATLPKPHAKVSLMSDVGRNIELKPVEKPNPYGTGCFATKDFHKGDLIHQIKGHISEEGDFESIQIDENRHLHMARPEVFLNHSCTPNGYVDFKSMEFRALRDIQKGEQLTWNYNTTEFILRRPFVDVHTGKLINGFKDLPAEEQKQLRPMASPFIQSKTKTK